MDFQVSNRPRGKNDPQNPNPYSTLRPQRPLRPTAPCRSPPRAQVSVMIRSISKSIPPNASTNSRLKLNPRLLRIIRKNLPLYRCILHLNIQNWDGYLKVQHLEGLLLCQKMKLAIGKSWLKNCLLRLWSLFSISIFHLLIILHTIYHCSHCIWIWFLEILVWVLLVFLFTFYVVLFVSTVWVPKFHSCSKTSEYVVRSYTSHK